MISNRLMMVFGVASLAAVACSSTVPKELVDARAAYQRASTGQAAQLNPAELLTAQQALTLAEKTFEDEGDSAKTRDRAYVATRKSETAEAQARISELDGKVKEADARANANRNAQIGNMQTQLAQTKDQLAAERARAEEADRRAKEAADALAKIAAVKQEPRGMVITLSGSVLFASNKSDLLPAAQAKLNDVATVLAKQQPDQKLVVEGHTDSQGDDAFNMNLSQKRAEAVRTYLTSHGVDPARIAAQGKGETAPIADNTSAEGRANNRRVEIVISPSASGANSTTTTPTNPNTAPAH